MPTTKVKKEEIKTCECGISRAVPLDNNKGWKCIECGLMKGEDTCQFCGTALKPIYENNGFTAPDPTHYEITGYEACDCGRTEEEQE